MKYNFNKDKAKSYKGSETTQLPQKYLKREKPARKDADNSTLLHSDSFKVITGKSQGIESLLVTQSWEKLSSLESDQK